MTHTNAKDEMPIKEYLICPFCKENDFDTIGLKLHLNHYCEAYAAVLDDFSIGGSSSAEIDKEAWYKILEAKHGQ